MTLKITVDPSESLRLLSALPAEVVPYAQATALTRTAQAAKRELDASILSTFANATAYTQRALALNVATVRRLEASVWLRWPSAVKPPEKHYLIPQIQGAAREQKPFEFKLTRAGYLSSRQFAVPGKGAKAGASGRKGKSLSAGQVKQILSEMRADELKAGVTSNRTERSAERMRKAGRLVEYFAHRGKGGTIDGIWQRIGKRQSVPVLVFVDQAKYRPKWKFYAISESVASRALPQEATRALDEALARVRAGRRK